MRRSILLECVAVIYRFGEFAVDTGTRQLLADATEVHLSPKSFELLQILIESHSRALSKAELQEMLWPSTFVGETNLATLVGEIRRALRDSAQEPVFVRTIHRFGYRFVGQLSSPTEAAEAARMMVKSTERDFLLVEGVTIMGRALDAAIRVDSGGVSRHHARITVAGDRALLEDLGSKNGTFLSGQRIESARLLQDGDQIRLGPVALTFRISSEARATETLLELPSQSDEG